MTEQTGFNTPDDEGAESALSQAESIVNDAADVLDASPAIEADNPEPTEPRVRLVDLPVDLSLHLAKVPIEDTLHLDRDRPAFVFVLQVVNTLPAVIVPLLDLDAERRPDVLRCQVGEVVGTTGRHTAQASTCRRRRRQAGSGRRSLGWS